MMAGPEECKQERNITTESAKAIAFVKEQATSKLETDLAKCERERDKWKTDFESLDTELDRVETELAKEKAKMEWLKDRLQKAVRWSNYRDDQIEALRKAAGVAMENIRKHKGNPGRIGMEVACLEEAIKRHKDRPQVTKREAPLPSLGSRHDGYECGGNSGCKNEWKRHL